MKVTKVAILGAGNGGLTAAADLAEQGFDISLYTWPTREYQFEGLINRGGLLLQEPNAEPPKEVLCLSKTTPLICKKPSKMHR
ncbi:MAG: hypothetical protein UDB11_07360 [Peptococcaceae bacterium]|nr:hypothetical protein [Peptococcaceae bacterium]